MVKDSARDKKILIVDDDDRSIAAFVEMARDLNFRVGRLTEGKSLIAALEEDRPDLIVLAVELADINGFLLCKQVKSDAKFKDIPLILISQDSDPAPFKKHQKLKDSAQAYFHKPLVIDDLVDTLEELIGLPPLLATKPEVENPLAAELRRLQAELKVKSRDLTVVEDSLETLHAKLEKKDAEIHKAGEQQEKLKRDLLNLQKQLEDERGRFEFEKRGLSAEKNQTLSELTSKEQELQGQIERLVEEGKDLKKQFDLVHRRSNLAVEENQKREGDLKSRINELLGEVDEERHLQAQYRQELEEARRQFIQEKEQIETLSRQIDEEKVRMEQRVVKAYKKIKLDQVRDEKILKALDVVRTLIERSPKEE